MADDSEQVIDGYCIVEQPGAEIEFGTPTGMARNVALIHAVKVTVGVPKVGTADATVTTVCKRQMPRQGVRRERSWDEQLKMPVNNEYLAGQAPACEECKALAPEHRVYGGVKGDPKYHLVTDSSVALGDWTSICGRLVDQNRGPHLWGEGEAAYCSDCEDLAAPAMRAQMAREEAERKRRGWGITPT
jgi:hypothetical protein